MNFSRRKALTGIAGGTALLFSGLWYKKWSSGNNLVHTSLDDYRPTEDLDVCIIGSGPAGCTLADDLTKQNKKVLILESGSSLDDSLGMQSNSALETYSSSGDFEYPLQGTRIRAIGGTSNVWTGRCPRMQPSDFSNNPLAPDGVWPIDYAEIRPYYSKAEDSLKVIGGKLGPSHAPRNNDLPGPSTNISELKALLEPINIFVDYPPVSSKRFMYFKGLGPVRYSKDVLPSLSQRKNITLVSNATVTKILINESGVVSGVKAQSIKGKDINIKAKKYIVACGAVESIRLLLLSDNTHYPGGIGNQNGIVGRYFMEHPWRAYKCEIPNGDIFDGYNLGRTYQYSEELKSKGLGGAVLAFYASSPNKLKIGLGIEMAPNYDNYISLNNNNLDGFGNPGANIKIGFSELDDNLWLAGEKIIHGILKQLDGINVTKRNQVKWSHHHMGGTRMSANRNNGVVDKNLKVHDSDNLYVLSSSVFVTAGATNPTLTIVALAHRLAEHLNSNL